MQSSDTLGACFGDQGSISHDFWVKTKREGDKNGRIKTWLLAAGLHVLLGALGENSAEAGDFAGQ